MQSGKEMFGIPRRSNPPRSTVYISGNNGFGSTGSKIKCFNPATLKAVGYNLIYHSETTLGDYIEVTADGVYTFSWNDFGDSNGVRVAIVKNVVGSARIDGSTSCDSTSMDDFRLATSSTGFTSNGSFVTVTDFFVAGDRISFLSNIDSKPTGTGSLAFVRAAQVNY